MVIFPSMQTTEVDQRLRVVVGILANPECKFFRQQRRFGTPFSGKWEFPGGKVEFGEDARTALFRELEEELGIQVTNATHLMTFQHDYEYTRVELEVFVVDSYEGIARGREGQDYVWCDSTTIREMDVLEAVHRILNHPQIEGLVQRTKSDE